MAPSAVPDSSPRGRRGPGAIARAALAAALLSLAWSLGAQAQTGVQLPPIPDDHHFVQDYAWILGPEVRREIGRIQEEAFERHGTPIVVVTIPRRAEYGGQDQSIEDFARAWFGHWGIVARGPEGEERNHGILLLVSVHDRAARIELGADWGREWDAYAQHVMDRTIVPRFQTGDYGAGTLEGVRSLLTMARLGPSASPPDRAGRLLDSLTGGAVGRTPLPTALVVLLLAAGIGLFVLSFFMPEHRQSLLLAGAVLVVAALVIWVLLVLLALMFRGRSGHPGGGGSGTTGGFRSSGGFGGGGFSGGGGATGRW